VSIVINQVVLGSFLHSGDIKAYNENGACFEFTLRDFHKE
jgi:hypothetical protein